MDVMAKMKERFIEGAIEHSGAKRSDMEVFWKQLEDFAAYCFNKSHAACYGLIAYWTAYLKAHYPEAFMAALMTSDQDDLDRLAIEMCECKHMGIKVLSPDVNESFVEFAVVPDRQEIRFGMAAIKGVGVSVVEEILRAREGGKFTSIEDFAKRVSTSRVNKRAWESLIKTGAFDSLADRSDVLFNLETIQGFASKLQKEALSGQTDLFGGVLAGSIEQPTVNMQTAPVKHTDKERLTWERELLGLYISAHPLDNYDTYFQEQTVPISEMTSSLDGKSMTIGGLVSTVRTIITKTGSKMAFVRIEDKSGESEIIVFPNLFEQVGSGLVQDAVIRVTGKVTARDREGNVTSDVKMIADDIQIVSDEELREYQAHGRKMAAPKPRRGVVASRKKAVQPEKITPKNEPTPVTVLDSEPLKTLYVQVKDPDNQVVLKQLKQACQVHPGLSDIVLVLGDEKKSAIKLPFRVETNDTLVGQLVKLVGEDAVVLKSTTKA